MVGAVSGVNSNYQVYGAPSVREGRYAQNVQGGQQAAVWTARRPASPDTPVQPVRPVTAVRGDETQPVRLGPVLREGADPAEMAVRMRIKPYEDSNPAGLAKSLDGNKKDDSMKVGAEAAQSAVEEGKCQTCEKRKYQDGSDDMGVSFQTPTRVDPWQAASAVRGHEQEHVVREQAKARREDRHVISQSVTIHTDICPECGKVYVSGGTTRTVTAANEEQAIVRESEQEQEKMGFSVFG